MMAMALAGCATVPKLPPAPQPKAAATLASAATLPGAGGAWPGDGWWQAYGDPELDRLMAEGLAGSPDIATAAARFERAQGVAREAGAADQPTLGVDASAGLEKQSYNLGIPPEFVPKGWISTGNVAARFGLDLDFWGRNRAQLRAALAERDAARIEQYAARLSLTAAIASAYADLAQLFADRDVAAEAVRIQADSLRLVTNRVEIGLDTPGQRKQAAAQVPAARADLAALDEQITVTRNRLAALVGAGPDRGLAIARPRIVALHPAALPDNAGIDLVGRRPDIAAARVRATAAAERIKAARADFYPNISLSGLIGFQSLGLGKLARGGSLYGNAGPALSLPIFDGGARAGRYVQARADYDAAVANYDATLTAALRDVADVIGGQRALAVRLREARAAVEQSEGAYRIAKLRYEGGLSTYLDVLTVEQQLIANRRRLADLDARAFTLDVALVQALGGGFALPTQGTH